MKVLLQIFASVDDFGLLNLAENSMRFECIAKIVLNERYSKTYLPVDPIEYYSEWFENFLQLFGDEIEAIEAIENETNNHWIALLLNRINNLEKLTLDLPYMQDENLLQHHAASSVTHLSLRIRFREPENGFVLAKFRNLKKMELIQYPSISFGTLKEIVSNNPGRESLIKSEK